MLSRAKRLIRRVMSGGEKMGEIKDDAFYDVIVRIASRPDIRQILEIGSSTGDGSTEAFVKGMAQNSSRPKLYCIEAAKDRFEILQKRYAGNSSIRCYNVSSVGLAGLPTEEQVSNFYRLSPTVLNDAPLDTIFGWLRGDLAAMKGGDLTLDGIALIKRESGVETFDAVLIDGSEFTGRAELDEVYGAKVILLDDINAFKNHYNCQRLMFDPSYRLTDGDVGLRGGYAVFERA